MIIIKLFEEQVQKHPDKLAIKTDSISLTYGELARRTDAIASQILRQFADPHIQNDSIALLFEHGTDMIIGPLASLKAGKIYVPCDPSYPENRLLDLLEDSGAGLLLTNSKNLAKAQQLVNQRQITAISILNIDELIMPNTASTPNATDWQQYAREDDIAYLLYTSGSTGKPKGVIQTQANVVYFIKNYARMLSITENDRLTLYSTFGHDAAVMDIYGGLLTGATLYPLNIKEQLNPERLVDWLSAEHITIWHSVPTLFRRFAAILPGDQVLPDLRLIILGGEAIREHDVFTCRQAFPQVTLVNLYGQTESSFNSAQLIAPNTPFEKILLGEPLDKTKLLLIDEAGKKVAPLRIGEIVINCEHIALGYWQNEEQTRKVFSSHPKLGRLYWTGDQGRLLLDGNIEFVGRKDFQLKVRGYRIETGEVESHILKHPAIKEVVVTGIEDQDGEMCLALYYVTRADARGVASVCATASSCDTPHFVQELRDFLRSELPEYMIPSYFMQLANLPMTGTGKVDRGALPDPRTALRSAADYVAPRNETEEKLAAIWQEILDVERVGIEDDFFSLGGNSLKATTAVSQIFKALNVEILLGDLFRYPTIRQLAEKIRETEESIFTSLQPVEPQEYYPVSSAQRRMFILNRLEGISTSYNLPKVMVVEGPLDRQQLEATLKRMIKRHETLRTSFKILEGEIVQLIHPEVDFAVKYLEADESQVQQVVQEFIQPFELHKAPLLRVGLVKLAPAKHVLLFDMHHIISDGASMGILINEFVDLYAGRDLPALAVQYKDFAVWQNELFQSGAIAKQEQYWLETFAGEIPALNLPTDYPRPATQSFEGDHLTFAVDVDLTGKLNALARETGSTLYMVLLAAYNWLIAKYTGQKDVIVGSPMAGRAHADLQNIIGIFVNFLPMRNYPLGDKRFRTFLREVKANSLKAYENQDYQYEHLVERLQIKRQLDRNPLFDTMLILQNTANNTIGIDNLQFLPYESSHTVAKLDLIFNAMETQGTISIEVEYCTKLFKRSTIERLTRHFTNILRQITTNPAQQLAEVELLSGEEKKEILQTFNHTQVDYPKNCTIHQFLEEQARLRPESVALVFDNDQLTYREFNDKTNQLARRLRKEGVRPDTLVAIITKRSLEMLYGIFAVLKAGAAYLPIDSDYPLDRIKYILEDSCTEIVLTQKKLLEEGGLVVDCETICLDDPGIYTGPTTELEPISTAENLAYVIYTSGSTGKPKGVMIEHHSVLNFIKGITERIDFTAGKSILALTTISFDIFGLETLLPLTQGLKVVIGNDEHQKDTKALNLVIRKHQIDMLQMTPSRMRMLLNDEQHADCLKDVKEIMIGGEALPRDLLAQIKAVTGARIYNMYGPTEATIWVTVKDLTDSEEITIGQPIANTGLLILNSTNQLQPVGVLGELCIVGENLARGYWNRPELSAEKFVANPWLDELRSQPALAQLSPTLSGARMYRTGDLARWLPNGDVEFVGRIDEQLKVRGFRIEPGEIEHQLLQYPAIKEAVVVARDTSGGRYLFAYLVGDGEVHVQDVKAHLAKELPDYMIPTYFLQIEALPYTPNGKVDKRALPEPDAGIISGVEYVAPANEIEAKLIQIWQEVLGIEGIGVNHNFFDIGGNSINIIKVISLISKRMGLDVPMNQLFLHPTVAEIAHNMFIENPLKGLECVISLNKRVEGKKNVFIIHTWEGIVYQYKTIAKLLEGEYNVYGIQAKGVMKPAKLPETMEEMVTDYIVEIKTIQPEGPYIIAGYCYGNWIAYKLVDMFEERGVPIEKFILIDENAWMIDRIRRYHKARTILSAPYRFTRGVVRKYITGRNKNPMDYWPSLEEYKKSKPPVPGEIKNEHTVREHINHLCSVGYDLRHIISSDVYVIKAEENNLVRYTPADWRKQTFGKVWFVEIPGGHESIFNYPYVEGLVKAFKRALEEEA